MSESNHAGRLKDYENTIRKLRNRFPKSRGMSESIREAVVACALFAVTVCAIVVYTVLVGGK